MTDALVLHLSEILLEAIGDHHSKKPEPETTAAQLLRHSERPEMTDAQLPHPFEINPHRQTDTATLIVMEDSETTHATTMMP
jgi:hypothetical protein